jgi:protease II
VVRHVVLRKLDARSRWASSSVSSPAFPELAATPRFLQREHKRVQQYMAPLRAVQRKLVQDMQGYEATDHLESPAEIVDGWMYYTRLDAGSESKVFCRRPVHAMHVTSGSIRNSPRDASALNRGEEIVLDLNTIFPTARYLCLGRLVVSHDHKYLAFTIDETGDETFRAYVKNLRTGELEHRIENANCIEWANTEPYALYYTYVRTHQCEPCVAPAVCVCCRSPHANPAVGPTGSVGFLCNHACRF